MTGVQTCALPISVECCALARLVAVRSALGMLGSSPSELASGLVVDWGVDGAGVEGKGNGGGIFLLLGNGACAGGVLPGGRTVLEEGQGVPNSALWHFNEVTGA